MIYKRRCIEMKKLVAVCDNELFMFAEKSADQLQETDTCVVYNVVNKSYAPELCVGSWTARVFGWEIPTEEQKKQAEQWIEGAN